MTTYGHAWLALIEHKIARKDADRYLDDRKPKPLAEPPRGGTPVTKPKGTR